MPRIGIFVCDCAGQVCDHVDTDHVVEVARRLDHVVASERVDGLCGAAGLERLTAAVARHRLDRVLFAGCSPRSSLKFPEEQLGAALARAGVDRALLEVANLREQCAWLHPDREAATRKATDLVRMAHARLRGASPSPGPVQVEPRTLVIGAGPAGLEAAKSLASAGQQVTLVERDTYLGGRLCQVGFLFQCEGWAAYCRSECVGPVQARDAILDPRIRVLLQSEVVRLETAAGNFLARIRRGARFVDPDRCVACRACAEVCPEEVVTDFGQGLFRRKAIDKEFERAVPDACTIVDEACTRCGECVKVCPTGAVDLDARAELSDETFGAVVLATGFDQRDLSDNPALGVGAPNVVSGLAFERLLDRGLALPGADGPPERVVFVLCAGSRTTMGKGGKGVPYCSKTCCGVTVKQAERVLARSPETEVVILYHRDVRAYERALESWYVRLKGLGAEFVDADVERAEVRADGRVRLRLTLGPGAEPDLDDAEEEEGKLLLDTDLVVLAAAQVPRPTTRPLLDQLGVLQDVHGFPREAQVRLFRPTETMVDRVFAVGAAVGPKVVQQAVEQGAAAAMKVLPTLLSGRRDPGRFVSAVAGERCIRCHACLTVCPHGAIRMTASGAVSDPGFCQACGFCAAACPTHAAQLVNFTDRQILDQAAVAFTDAPPGDPRILALLCYWCSYSGGDLAGVKGMTAPASFRSIRIRCSSSVNSGLILEMLRLGVDGVLVAGCPDRSCHHAWGNYLSDRRVALMRTLLGQLGVSERRVRFEYIGVPQSQKFVDTLVGMDADLRALGPNPVASLAGGLQ